MFVFFEVQFVTFYCSSIQLTCY